MADDEPDELDRDTLRELARNLKCPRCGSAAGVSCMSFGGRFMTGFHAERLSVAEGGADKENREHVWWRRTPGQGRMDPGVTVRRINDESEAA